MGERARTAAVCALAIGALTIAGCIGLTLLAAGAAADMAAHVLYRDDGLSR